jgi:hypothetical protein
VQKSDLLPDAEKAALVTLLIGRFGCVMLFWGLGFSQRKDEFG